MAKVTVVADTCHYLQPALIEQYGIEQVSLHVLLPDGTERKDSSYNGDYTEYYDILSSSPTLPTTSQPSHQDFLDVWEPILDRGEDILSMHLSADLSGTFAGAQAARESLGDRGSRITVVNTRSVAGGEALVVLAGAAAVRAGMSASAAAEHATAARAQMKIWFAVDTLEYMEKGGRIGAAAAWLGTALKIKPILTFEDQVEPVERVRTSKRALERMSEYLQTLKESGADTYLVQHITAHERADELVQRGIEIFGHEPTVLSEVGPVAGTYLGPGLLGVGGMPSSFMNP
ncbi:MAG: DegV family protein [Solirubrobacterales bacterium]|nr:DegV family protein [Solirubrobacterales bacterium]